MKKTIREVIQEIAPKGTSNRRINQSLTQIRDIIEDWVPEEPTLLGVIGGTARYYKIVGYNMCRYQALQALIRVFE